MIPQDNNGDGDADYDHDDDDDDDDDNDDDDDLDIGDKSVNIKGQTGTLCTNRRNIKTIGPRGEIW